MSVDERCTASIDGVALVTGGGSGIGAACAAHLAAAGTKVVVADIDDRAARRVARDIDGRPAQVDVTDRGSVAALLESLDCAPDVLVTCAGGAPRCAALDVGEDLFTATWQLNVGGFWRCVQESSRRAVRERRRLKVVHVASSLHAGPAPDLSHFAAAKAASVTLVRCLAQELAPQGVVINAILPGPVDTPMTRPVWEADPRLLEVLETRIPLGRVGTPDDVARLVEWLASPATEWMTGAMLTLDGGLAVAA